MTVPKFGFRRYSKNGVSLLLPESLRVKKDQFATLGFTAEARRYSVDCFGLVVTRDPRVAAYEGARNPQSGPEHTLSREPAPGAA